MWGTSYKYRGYLIRITKNEMDSKEEENITYINGLKNDLIALAAMSPPPSGCIEDEEGERLPWHEHIAYTVDHIVEELLNTQSELTHIHDAQETLREHPEDVEDD